MKKYERHCWFSSRPFHSSIRTTCVLGTRWCRASTGPRKKNKVCWSVRFIVIRPSSIRSIEIYGKCVLKHPAIIDKKESNIWNSVTYGYSKIMLLYPNLEANFETHKRVVESASYLPKYLKNKRIERVKWSRSIFRPWLDESSRTNFFGVIPIKNWNVNFRSWMKRSFRRKINWTLSYT